jgi:hypothetical protein
MQLEAPGFVMQQPKCGGGARCGDPRSNLEAKPQSSMWLKLPYLWLTLPVQVCIGAKISAASSFHRRKSCARPPPSLIALFRHHRHGSWSPQAFSELPLIPRPRRPRASLYCAF